MNRKRHSTHFDSCRICLRRPDPNINIHFLNIFRPLNGGKTLKEYIKDLFNINVEPNDQKPHNICETCYISIIHIKEVKEEADKSKVITDYQTSKKNNVIKYQGQFVCCYSEALKTITYNTDTTRKIESKCIQKISNLEGSDYHPLGGSDAIEDAIDPNEPRFCLCDQIEFGKMIACDYRKCTTEWFHFDCVGIIDPPRGKWYCPKCRNKVKKLKMF